MSASRRSAGVSIRPSAAGLLSDLGNRLAQVDQHHDAGLGGNAGKRDELDGDSDGQIEAKPPPQPEPADSANGCDNMMIMVSVTDLKLR